MRLSSFITSASSAATFAGLLATSARAQSSLTEASQAAITDPAAECAYYTYAPVANEAANFPPNWVQPATIVATDAAANAKWNSIKGSVPTNIPTKGTIAGDFSNFTPTYSPSDPDCWWTYDKCVTPKLAGLKPDTSFVPEPLTLGYGFDDGPNCSHNAFYDFLSEQKQKATMFYIGSNVQNHALEAQRALADGHEICVHTWSHPYMTAVPSEGVFAELYYTMQMIKLATGVTPTCWRPPYGDIDDRVRSIANALGLRSILWQYDSNDWQVGSTATTPAQVDANYQALITSAGNGTFNTQGTIILTHELNNYTMQEAINFYPKLKAAFKALVPVGVAMNISQPYVETNYTLPSFSQYTSGTTTANATGSASGSAKPSSTGASGASQSGGALAVGAFSASTVVAMALGFVGGAMAIFA
ncbi:carbohydrate esterase family 4 protein [Athelia psychrophila]|uniref:chitin deacetylase n=1 Tax=Athelia psychrophila TaxID=1759441 RepID=A0A166E9L7_9AGAM|nr:carbohydrate esterase family 4 protein [Fibularhizoctonia sp. CBS 109695]